MDFTHEEKKACVLILMSLADCDGRRNSKEIEILVKCSNVLGVSTDELLGGLLQEAALLSDDDLKSILKPMDSPKKIVLEECMKKIVEADGPANDTEIGVWWTIQMEYDLPTWVSRKKE